MYFYYYAFIVFIVPVHGYSSSFNLQLIDHDQEDLSGILVAFDTTMENYTVPVSGKCILTCYVAEVRSFKVLWQKIERTNESRGEQLTLIAFDGIVYSNKDHYRLESDYVGSYNLIIDRVNEDDQGEYQCQINTEPRKTKRIFLTVQVPPRIIDFRPNPPLFSIRTGASLTLLCRAEGTPTPRIRWRIRDVESNGNDLLAIPPDNSNIWYIPTIDNHFPRTVECIADNGVLPASNRIFTINVEYPPVVMISNDLIQSRLYENVTLECSISSRPLAHISWEKNGQIIEENQMNYIQINQSLARNRLNIQMTNEDDFGQYNCIAENIHGRMEAIVFVLKESMVLSTVTTKKFHRQPKKFNVTRKYLRLTTSTAYIERGIQITSSSSSRWTIVRWETLLLLFFSLFQLSRIHR